MGRRDLTGRNAGAGLDIRRFGLAVLLAMALLPTPAAAQIFSGDDSDPQPPEAADVLLAFQDCGFCPEMVIVPAGSFMIGASDGDALAYDNETPRHAVTFGSEFAIGRNEVTFAQWDACVAHNGCRHRPSDQGWGRGDMPVMDISWDDAVEYVVWLSGYTGQPYRLPSEAEWEYAARAGQPNPDFWDGNPAEACTHANVSDRTAQEAFPEWEILACTDGHVTNAPVGGFAPNGFGLHDTLGNVWEWVADCWNPGYGGAPTDGSAWLTGDCRQRVLRGGAATGLPREVRLSQRGVNDRDLRAVYNGLRVAVQLAP